MPRSEICEPAKAFEFISERCAIFRNASRACFEKHMKNSTVVTAYDEGELILSPSDRASDRGIGIIRTGSASVYSGDSSRRVLMRFLSVGGIYGVAALFAAAAPPTRIVAGGDCTVLKLPREAVRAMLHEDAALLDNYLEFMSGRVLFLNRKIACVTGGSAERRLAVHLLSLSDGLPRESDGSVRITLASNYTELSHLIDVGIASLYRALDSLEASGAIKRGSGYDMTVFPALLEAMLDA